MRLHCQVIADRSLCRSFHAHDRVVSDLGSEDIRLQVAAEDTGQVLTLLDIGSRLFFTGEGPVTS